MPPTMDDDAQSVRFDSQLLIDEACEAAGLTNFGSDNFRKPLDVLLKTYDTNHTTVKGRKKAYRRVVGLLSTRLRIEEALRKNPEITERPIARPMVLTGLPRSGTSALFNLLGADPAARPLLLWETQFPDPMEGLKPGAKDPRHAAIEAYYAKSREDNPEFTKMHFASADTPEECVLIHAFTLNGVHHGIEPMLEPYASWYRDQDLGEMYDYYKVLLQMLDWQRPGDRWLLKAPAHMWAIDSLIKTFPDVSIVWSHRNPVACTASICSMTHMLLEDQVDMPKDVLGPIVMDFYATSLERGLAVRDTSDPARFVDVNHDDFVANSRDTVERIYGHFDIAMEGPASNAIDGHIEANPKGQHGKHVYNLDDWGLSVADVEKRFAPYVERFSIDMD